MSAKIATLPGVTVVGPTPRENVIAEVERLLGEAKTGKAQTVGFFFITADGYITTCLATSGSPHAHHSVAAAHYLLGHATRVAERNDEDG